MKKTTIQLLMLVNIYMLCLSVKASANDKDTAVIAENSNRTGLIKTVESPDMLLKSNTAAKTVLGVSKQGRPLEVYYFPGTGTKKALVIGGIHGSELSSVEIAWSLIEYMKNSARPYYSVIIIPVLFPDNAAAAQSKPGLIGSTTNYGRYTNNKVADPNRQMPSLGTFTTETKDHLGRPIETENRLLLELINMYRPQRMVSIHAIRDTSKAGIFADPRTDAAGIALGYSSDSSLAVEMAKYVYSNGGYIPGNHINGIPSALYHCDHPAAPTGFIQPRNLHGSALPNRRGEGVSLGGWASTAIADTMHPEYNRDAIRILTMEFPGYKRSSDYTTLAERLYTLKLIQLYAASIRAVFLDRCFEE